MHQMLVSGKGLNPKPNKPQGRAFSTQWKMWHPESQQLHTLCLENCEIMRDRLFQSRLISKRAKSKLYYPVIRPIVTYSCETWILKETIINELMVFERKILKKIFGPNNENGIWRIKTNQEPDEIIKRKNITNFIWAQRLSWLGHIERMQGTRMVKAIYSWKPISRRPIGRPKTRWVDDVRKDIKKLKLPNWKTLAQDRGRWRELVEKAKTL